jgi:hypothetical protein
LRYIRLPALRPSYCASQATAYAGRFVLTARTEVADRVLILDERHLRRTLGEYARHYNGRRPHRALELQPSRSDRPPTDLTDQWIRRRPVLGELITEYERAAQNAGSPSCDGFGTPQQVQHQTMTLYTGLSQLGCHKTILSNESLLRQVAVSRPTHDHASDAFTTAA